MKLVRADDLRTQLGLGAVDSFVAAAEAAADQATTHIVNDLRTPLERSTYEDIYVLGKNDFGLPKIGLKLTAGFVQGSVTVGTGTTLAGARADTSSLAESAIVSAESGHVLLTDAVLGKYVVCTYTAGFEKGSEPDIDLLIGTPEWLSQLAEVKAIALMADMPEFKNKEGKLIDGKAWSTRYAALVPPRIRYLPGSRLPLP